MSDSLQPHGLLPARFLCPQDFPGKNTGVRCHFLLQRIFLIQGSNPCLLHWQVDSLTTELPGKPIVTIRTGLCSDLGEGNASQKNPPGGREGRGAPLAQPSPEWRLHREVVDSQEKRPNGGGVWQGDLGSGWFAFNLSQKTDMSKEIKILFPRKTEWKGNYSISL